ncbi:hypothetical protein NDU88_000851 [Pleurodeles waltl]|uniref:Uncharacterized protein n=1 Tax=Pleurodeles waltl TaxID=8319 RepID=A0AAV7VXF5_PLEWA|nr:hypothetical protein NDU88_000851 [Pleurodeles waltl]
MLSSQGNEDAGTRLGNLDIRVPRNTKREGGLGAREADEKEEDERNADREPQETREEKRFGNTEDSPKTTDHPKEGEGSGTVCTPPRPRRDLANEDNAAQDSPELRPQLFVRDVDEGLPSSQGNEDAGTRLGNPDIRVPRNTKREEGLSAREADEKEEDEWNADREPQETREERRFGNTEDSPKTTDHPRERNEVEPPALRHVPGGTWLTKQPFAIGINRGYREAWGSAVAVNMRIRLCADGEGKRGIKTITEL